MSAILSINVDDLLHRRTVESERVEFKAAWDTERTGPQVIRTICAFANDYHNLNGGYIVIGVEEKDGRSVLPPRGMTTDAIDRAQRWIRGQCNRMDPAYPPVLSPESVGDRHVLVVHAPGSEMRPHRAPGYGGGESLRYWIRLGSETVNAERRGDYLRRLIEQTAKVPWDDRRASARVEDLRESKVREYLRDVRSGLLETEDARDIYRRMRIISRVNNHEVPKNAALLFFTSDPERWIRGARIEVVQFAADRAGNVQEERKFTGSLVDQIVDCQNYLDNLSTYHLQKQRDRQRVRGWVSYPMAALRETLVNAVYHRGYDVDQPEPTKVYLFPSRIEVISYPGPVSGIEPHHLRPGARPPAVPARNRRIGEFLKELRLAEGRLSGLPKIFDAMEANGSPTPTFEFDEHRTFFQVTLPAHPEYAALSALRDASHLRALGETEAALSRIESAWQSNPASGTLAAELTRMRAEDGDIGGAREVYEAFTRHGHPGALHHVRNTLIDALMDGDEHEQARELLLRDATVEASGQDAIDAAILARRAGEQRAAHRYFGRAGDVAFADPRALLEFAQTKIWLAHPRRSSRSSRGRFLAEARELLERVVQMEASATRHAWAWRELGRVRNWLRAPLREVEDAFARAMEMLPGESRFAEELTRIRQARGNRRN